MIGYTLEKIPQYSHQMDYREDGRIMANDLQFDYDECIARNGLSEDVQRQEDKVLVSNAMRNILKNKDATPGQLLFATETLDYLVGGVGVIPYRAHMALDGQPVDLTIFAAAVDAIAEAREKEKQYQDSTK